MVAEPLKDFGTKSRLASESKNILCTKTDSRVLAPPHRGQIRTAVFRVSRSGAQTGKRKKIPTSASGIPTNCRVLRNSKAHKKRPTDNTAYRELGL